MRAVDCFEDEAGVTGRPPKGRTWGRRGITRRCALPAVAGAGLSPLGGGGRCGRPPGPFHALADAVVAAARMAMAAMSSPRRPRL